MSAWEHERTLVACEGGSEVTDRITFQMRPPLGWIPGAHAVLAFCLRWLFGHRHRRLARWFERVNAKAPTRGNGSLGAAKQVGR
jgi:hypothetical protein